MNSVPRKTLRIISVVAAVCLFQVYVLAAATAPNAVANPNANSSANVVMLGRLMLTGSQSILVNGSSANSGTTILSGSRLQTPADVEATVQLGSAGKLYIQPNTNLTVTFDKTNVDVKVAAGSAFVAPSAGVTSSVTGPDGKTSATGGEPGGPGDCASKTKADCTGNCKWNDDTNKCEAKRRGAAGGLSDGEIAGIVIAAGVGTGLIIYFATKNSSP